jgi:hypothetical protein
LPVLLQRKKFREWRGFPTSFGRNDSDVATATRPSASVFTKASYCGSATMKFVNLASVSPPVFGE